MVLGGLGIPEAQEWKRQNVVSLTTDKPRGLTYIQKKMNKINYCLLQLHEYEKRFQTLENVEKNSTSPVASVNKLLNQEWEILNENNLKKRENKIGECSALFPLRFVLVSHDHMSSSFDCQINIIGHCRVMKIAGKEFELYFDQFIIDNVGLLT